MKYFLEEATATVFAFEADGSQDFLITSTMRAMSEAEVAAHLAPKKASAEDNKAEARRKLADTDWVTLPDVLDTTNTTHLVNSAEFIAYRAQLRNLCINPVGGDIAWPQQPSAIWA